MQFNPLFIQPVNQGDVSSKVNNAGTKKLLNLNNSSYLFSDIIRIVNENLPEGGQSASSSEMNNSNHDYPSIEDNFKYRMFITLAKNSQISVNDTANSLNINNVNSNLVQVLTNNIKTPIQANNQSKSIQTGSNYKQAIDNTCVNDILGQLAALFENAGIKPESFSFSNTVSAQINSGETNNLLNEINQQVTSQKSSDIINPAKRDNKKGKITDDKQKLSNLLLGILQSNGSISLNLTAADGNNIKIEIANSQGNTTNTSAVNSIIEPDKKKINKGDNYLNTNITPPLLDTNSLKEISLTLSPGKNFSFDSSVSTDLTNGSGIKVSGNINKTQDYSIPYKASLKPGLYSETNPELYTIDKITPKLKESNQPTSSSETLTSMNENANVFITKVPNEIQSSITPIPGSAGIIDDNTPLKGFANIPIKTANEYNIGNEIQSPSFQKFNGSYTKLNVNSTAKPDIYSDIQQKALTPDSENIMLNVPDIVNDTLSSFNVNWGKQQVNNYALKTDKHSNDLSSELNNNTHLSIPINTKENSAEGKFIISISREVAGAHVKDFVAANTILNNFKKEISGKLNGNVNFKLDIKYPAQQKTIAASDQRADIKKDFTDKNLEIDPTKNINANTADYSSAIIEKQVSLNIVHSNNSVEVNQNNTVNQEVKTDINSNKQTNIIDKSSPDTNLGGQSEKSFNNSYNDASNDNTQRNISILPKKTDILPSILNNATSIAGLNPANEKIINDILPPKEQIKTYKISEVLNEIKSLITSGNVKSAILQLKPVSLGKVKVTMDVADNVVHAHVEVENESVKQVIQNNVNDLKQSLNLNGMQLNSFTVNVSSGEQKPNKFFSQKKSSNTNSSKIGTVEEQESIMTKSLGYNTYEFLA